MRIIRIIAIATVALWLTTPSAFSEQGDESLRTQALALNNVTGDDAIRAKTVELIKDKPALRKLLAEAVAIAKENDKDRDKGKGDGKPGDAKKSEEKQQEKDQPFNYNAARILSWSAHLARDYDTAEVFYKICIEHAVKLEDTEKLVISYSGLINLYDQAKKYPEAYYVCEKLLDLTEKQEVGIEAARPKIYEQMIQILAKQKKFDKAVALCDDCIEKYPHFSSMFILRKAHVYRLWGKWDDSIAEYKKYEELVKESNSPLKDKILEGIKYQLTSVYVDAGQPDKSIELLEELVKDHPETSTYNNDLGYILADNDKRLDEAERFVRKALEQDREKRKKAKEGKAEKDEDEDSDELGEAEDKDNAAYVDSLAWVFFKQKKYAEARDLLLEAVKSEDGQHVEIFDHLADVYLALGQKDDAVKTWQKALATENLSLRDETRKVAIKKKIDANK